MSQASCPRCGSRQRALAHFIPLRHLAPQVPVATYTCRDAWHMPALSEEAESALELMAEVDVMFSGDIRLDAKTLAYDPMRQSTAGYP